jgi:PAS domain S-box-containing protein
MILGFILALIFVAGSLALTYESGRGYLQTNGWLMHTQEVLLELQSTQSALQDAESGVRGYVLTGSAPYLEPYQVALRTTPAHLDRLRTLIADNPTQRARFARLAHAVDQRLQTMRNILDTYTLHGREAARLEVATGRGKAAMDSVRSLVAEMDHEEERLLQRRHAAAATRAQMTFVAIGLLGLATAGLLAGMYFLITRFLRDRWTAELKERRLQVERDRFFELSRDLLCVAGFDGHFTRLNASWEKTLGFTREELQAEPWLAFVHPDDRESTLAVGADVMAGKEAIAFENRYRCKDGSYRWLQWNATPWLDQGVIFAVARDVTEQRRHETELLAAKETAEAANRELESFSYSVSHDLRGPLRAIDGFSQVLAEDYGNALDAEGRRYIERVRNGCRRMGELIEDLLQLSRLSRTEIRREAVDLGDVARHVVEELQMRDPARRVHLEIAGNAAVEGDVRLLRIVLENLLSNAWKFTRHVETARIEFGVTSLKGRPTFYVRDNGAGFDMAYAGKLFGAFQRLHRVDEFEGTGIGLATVQRIIHRHGGQVWAESEVGSGARFFFTVAA